MCKVQSQESGTGGSQAGKVGKVDIEIRATHWLLLFGPGCFGDVFGWCIDQSRQIGVMTVYGLVDKEKVGACPMRDW